MKENLQKNGREITQVPTEGKWFNVNPLTIDQNLFKEERIDRWQEETRQLILEAFEEVKKNSKYAKPFKIMMPEKTWGWLTVKELKWVAKRLGHHNADWVEWVLMLAQRIANRESWEAVCNEIATTKWYGLVVWKDGHDVLVGASLMEDGIRCVRPAARIPYYAYDRHYTISYTVPLVVSYKKTRPM